MMAVEHMRTDRRRAVPSVRRVGLSRRLNSPPTARAPGGHHGPPAPYACRPVVGADPWRTVGARASTRRAAPAPCRLCRRSPRAWRRSLCHGRWRPGSSPDERQYELILSTQSYDAWLIHWPAGSSVGAHDHGGSAGAFAVVSGVLEEQTVVRSANVTRRVATGESLRFGADHVHAVFNGSDAAATSVHVYSATASLHGLLPGRQRHGRS